MNWCRAGIVEGNQVHNLTYGGPYLETQSARDIIVRNNFFRNVLKGPFLNMGQVHPTPAINLSALVRDGADPTIALATTGATPHGLVAGERVRIDASSETPAQFKGIFVVKSVEPPYQFRYRMPSAPTQNATGGTMQKVFSVGRFIIEGNVVEMPADTTAQVGIHIHDNALSNQAPDHALGDLLIRNNKIRYLDGLAEPTSTGSAIEVNGAKNLLVRDNVVDVTPGNPLRNQRCRSVKYFNNRNIANEVPGLPLVQGLNVDTGRKYDEPETEAEDAFVLAFMSKK
jgi:hypothetical protein